MFPSKIEHANHFTLKQELNSEREADTYREQGAARSAEALATGHSPGRPERAERHPSHARRPP